jgi:hypothetical protein
MMTTVGERGGKVMARRLQGEDEATEMQRQSEMAPAGELIEFTGRNRPEGAMLSMDSDPLQFDSERRFFGGHLEVKPSTSRWHSSPPARVRPKIFTAVL